MKKKKVVKPRVNNAYFMWTKENIKTVLQLWDTLSKEEIAEKIGCEASQVAYIAAQVRKEGYHLQKK